MIRSKDLDNVAPDDPVEVKPSKTEPQQTPKTPKNQNKEETYSKIYNILGHTKSSFSSFLVKPDVIDFPERNDNEQIILALRPHWFTNVSWLLMTILMLFLPLAFSYFNFLAFLPTNYQSVALLFWFLITFIYAFEKFLGWYFDLYIITNQRIVDISFNNLLNKKFAEADISMIQDASSSVKGVAGTMFNYGTVLIQTASEINQIIFESISSPEKVIKILQELREEDQLKLSKGEQ
jgi:hypothetical protein